MDQDEQSGTGLPVLNREELFEQYSGYENILSQSIGIFLSEAPEKVRLLKQETENGAYEAAGKLAHSLVNNAGLLHAEALAEASRKLDERVRRKEYGMLPELADSISQEAERLFRELESVRDELTRQEK